MSPDRQKSAHRSIWLSPYLLAVALTPALMQQSLSCKSGDTTLSEFAIIVDGEDQLQGFDPQVRSYSIALPTGTDEALVHSMSTDPEARVWIDVIVDGERLRYVHGALGGGDMLVPLPSGSSTIEVWVRAPGGASDSYDVRVASSSRRPLAIEFGHDIHIPVEIAVLPESQVLTAAISTEIDVSMTAYLTPELFCYLSQGLGNFSLHSAAATIVMAGVSTPVPHEVTLTASRLPNISTAEACSGPAIPLEFPAISVILSPDGSRTVDFVLAADRLDFDLSGVFYGYPTTSLFELVGSPRIVADTDFDGVYDSPAQPEHQIQLPVDGYCLGFPCDDGNDCTIDQCDAYDYGRCTYIDASHGTQCAAEAEPGVCFAGVCGTTVFPCTEQGLRDAITQGGGPHRFDCAAATPVVLQSDLVVNGNVVLQGENKLVIDGNRNNQIVIIEGVSATLGGLTFTRGGGIENNGILTVENSTITHHAVSDNGGGIYNGETGVLTLDSSLVAYNEAALAGGGIANRGTATITNSTISSNTSGSGGGIANSILAAGAVNIVSSTVANNAASRGSAIYNNGTTKLASTLVQGDCDGVVTSSGYNVESPGDSCGLVTLTDLSRVSVSELNLGSLANNGRPTATHALLSGSAARDRIPASACVDEAGQRLTRDQRGFPRPDVAQCDVGAFEAYSFPCTEQGVREAISAGGGPHKFDCDGATTIYMTRPVMIEDDVILDGGGDLTIQQTPDTEIWTYGWMLQVLSGKSEFAGISVRGGVCQTTGTIGGGIRISESAELTLSDGDVTQAGGGSVYLDACEYTRALSNAGTFTMTDGQVSYVASSGALRLERVRFTGGNGNGLYNRNSAIRNSGNATIIDSTISGYDFYYGGTVVSNEGTLLFVNSTISDNEAVISPEVRLLYNGGVAVVINSTISNDGGAVSAIAGNGGLHLISSTVVGGSQAVSGGPNVRVRNSVIVGWSPCGGAPVISDGGNIVGPGNDCGFTDPSDIENVPTEELALGPLQDNGGQTQTFSLLPGSIAIDWIPVADCVDAEGEPLSGDQRGELRPAGSGCDAGAFEVQR